MLSESDSNLFIIFIVDLCKAELNSFHKENAYANCRKYHHQMITFLFSSMREAEDEN